MDQSVGQDGLLLKRVCTLRVRAVWIRTGGPGSPHYTDRYGGRRALQRPQDVQPSLCSGRSLPCHHTLHNTSTAALGVNCQCPSNVTIIEIVDAGTDQRRTRTRTRSGLALACTSNGSYDTSTSRSSSARSTCVWWTLLVVPPAY